MSKTCVKKRKKYKSRKHAHHLKTYIKDYPGGAMVIPDDDSVLERGIVR